MLSLQTQATKLIVEFPSERRESLIPLFSNHQYLHLISKALLKEGIGKAYTNDIDNPTTALLIHKSVVFLTGDTNDSDVPELLERIPDKRLIFVSDNKWVERLREKWGEDLHEYPRTKFSSDSLDIEYMKDIIKGLPEGMTIERVTSENIHDISDLAKNIIGLLFPSLDSFIETNFGFCVLEGDTIVSLALAATPFYEKEFEVHIETHPDYQKRGLAMISGAVLIKYSLENGYTPHWDADNEPSAKLAKKLGYSKAEQYHAFYWLDKRPQLD